MTFSPAPVLKEEGLWHIIPFLPIRTTPNVEFHAMPLLPKLSAIDRVMHAPGAKSPMIKDRPDLRPWYMHTDQDDNLVVLHGMRIVQLYTPQHGKVETFHVYPDRVEREDGTVLYSGPCIFGWPPHAFHRVESPDGSASINFAQHFEGFDIATNFNIYEVNIETGEYTVAREGKLDQPADLTTY